MEAIQQLDLKSDEAHEKKGLSETSVYLIKNTDVGLDAPLLEPPQNEGIMSSEDSSENVKTDIIEESDEEVDSLGCCSCFSFNFFKGKLVRKYKKETADNQTTNTTSNIIRIHEWNDTSQAEMVAEMSSCESSILLCEILEEDYLRNEFKKPVKHADIPLPKGS